MNVVKYSKKHLEARTVAGCLDGCPMVGGGLINCLAGRKAIFIYRKVV